MSTNRLLISDNDLAYGKALAKSILNLHQEFDITVMSSDKIEKMGIDQQSFIKSFDLILTGNLPAETEEWSISNRIVVLTNYRTDNIIKQSQEEGKHPWYLYKYRNVNKIISDINFLIGFITGRKNLLRDGFSTSIIGFYAMSGGVGKSVISFGVSRELSRYHDKKVLFLCFEEFPSTGLFYKVEEGCKDIGNYLYFLFNKQNGNLCSFMEAFTISDEYGVDTFLPSGGRNDLKCLTKEELACFIKHICDSNRYDYIVFDLPCDLSEETVLLMNLCSRLALIHNDSPISQFKFQKFKDYLNIVKPIKTENELIHDELIRDELICGDLIHIVNMAEHIEYNQEEKGRASGDSRSWIYIEKDDNSFRSTAEHLDIDINHTFGIGIKKIADEIEKGEKYEQ